MQEGSKNGNGENLPNLQLMEKTAQQSLIESLVTKIQARRAVFSTRIDSDDDDWSDDD